MACAHFQLCSTGRGSLLRCVVCGRWVSRAHLQALMLMRVKALMAAAIANHDQLLEEQLFQATGVMSGYRAEEDPANVRQGWDAYRA